MDPIFLISMTVFVLAAVSIAWAAVHGYRLFGGLRFVSCPETVETAVVQIDVKRATLSKLAGRSDLRLQSCSRWPELKGCDQACLSQVAASTNGCRPRSLLVRSEPPRRQAWVSGEFVGATRDRWSRGNAAVR